MGGRFHFQVLHKTKEMTVPEPPGASHAASWPVAGSMAIVLLTPGRLAAGLTRESSYKMAFGASFAVCAKERILAKKKRYGVRLWLWVLHLVRTHTHAVSARQVPNYVPDQLPVP